MTSKASVLALLLLALPAQAAEPFASDWTPSAKSRARVIADGAGGAGFQVELAPGAITYWRDPGDAGVPPTFDFAGSENVARAEALFPAPSRIAEPDGGQAFGYERAVVFPIRVEPTDSAKPVVLALNVNYAVCEKICLPAKASAKLTIPVGVQSPFAADLASARARVPAPTDAAALGLTSAALDDKTWRLCAPAAGAARDLFVEPPAGWWMTARAEGVAEGRECFSLDLRESPAQAAFPVDVRVTLVGARGASETRISLARK